MLTLYALLSFLALALLAVAAWLAWVLLRRPKCLPPVPPSETTARKHRLDLIDSWQRRMAELGAEKATEADLSDLDCRRCIACGHPLPGAGPTAQVSAGVGIWVRRVPDGPLCGPYCCGDCASNHNQEKRP